MFVLSSFFPQTLLKNLTTTTTTTTTTVYNYYYFAVSACVQCGSRASLVRRFTDTNLYTEPIPLKCGKTRHKISMVYGYFLQCTHASGRLCVVCRSLDPGVTNIYSSA